MKFKPFAEEKIWGSVSHIFASKYAAVSCLQLKADYRSSCHYHKERANLFALMEGCVCIEQWNYGLNEPSSVRALHPGQTHQVHSGIWHRFRVIEDSKLVEVYWADRGGEVLLNDIVRHDEGGLDDFEELKKLLSEGCKNDS